MYIFFNTEIHMNENSFTFSNPNMINSNDLLHASLENYLHQV